jgi:hypothetical protein
MWITIAVTIWSGFPYLFGIRKMLSGPSVNQETD